MAESQAARRWLGRSVFVIISLVLLFAQMLPLQTAPRPWAPPDVLLAMTLAWVIRRPDLVPVVLIAGLYFFADLMLQRPPGLSTAMIIIVTEILRRRVDDIRSSAFALEWVSVTAAIVALALANRAVLAFLMLPQAPVMLTFSQTVATVIAYPAIVFLSYLAFGVSRPAMGELDDMGRRI